MELKEANPKFQDVSIAPMHTTEHSLNQTMLRSFGCPRFRNHLSSERNQLLSHSINN